MRSMVLLLDTVMLISCGGGSSPEEQIKSTTRAYAHAIKNDDAGDMCRQTTAQDACLQTVESNRALGVKLSDLITGREDNNIDHAKVIVTGDRAYAVFPKGRANYVKRDGKWLLVFDSE